MSDAPAFSDWTRPCHAVEVGRRNRGLALTLPGRKSGQEREGQAREHAEKARMRIPLGAKNGVSPAFAA